MPDQESAEKVLDEYLRDTKFDVKALSHAVGAEDERKDLHEELVEPGMLSKMEQQFERNKHKQIKRQKMKAQGNVKEKVAKAQEREEEPRAKGKAVGQKGRRIIRRRASFYLAFKGVGLAKDEPLPVPLLQDNSQFWIDSVRSQYTFGNLSSTSIPEEAPKISTNVLPWRKLPDHVFSKEELDFTVVKCVFLTNIWFSLWKIHERTFAARFACT